MTARLHVFLGQGGVGKTTLACAYALALSRCGRVGLLGVDPAGRLKTALGISGIGELPAPLPDAPRVSAALLRPSESMRRWAAEGCDDATARARLLANPFFLALADRVAAATDALAAIRVAEWAERDPALDDLVVDTAPGLHGLEFLGRPDKLLSVLQGKLLRWVSNVATGRPSRSAGARRIVRGLSRIGGARVLLELAEFSFLVQDLAGKMISRLEHARDWLRAPDTELLLVCAARADAAAGVRSLSNMLRELRLTPGLVVLNRALPVSLSHLESPVPGGREADAFVNFVRASLRLQETIAGALDDVVRIPIQSGLDGAGPARLSALRELGEHLLNGIEQHRRYGATARKATA